MTREGNIAAYINEYGYSAYANRNVGVYEEVRSELIEPTVFALSSGFMTYPMDINKQYQPIFDHIESHELTSLLMPVFELEPCVEIIVQRQLARPYLEGNAASEERRIRKRFEKFMSLRCSRFTSNDVPETIALEIERFMSGRILSRL